MKQLLVFGIGVGLAFLLACSNESVLPTSASPELESDKGSVTGRPFDAGLRSPQRNFRTHLSGSEQVPDPVDTRAQGQAIIQLSKDGTELYFKVIVANIEDVVGAHIHNAARGANGPIVLSMVPDTAGFLANGAFIPNPGVTVNGVLVEGTATAADLLNPLQGKTLEDLVAEMMAGNTYVNVHTVSNRGGEIRGQIH